MEKNFDVIVIGAGPAGYVASIRCAQLGMKTACIDNWLDEKGQPSPGGTCLNVGCIPSKALLESSALYVQASQELEGHGITTGPVSFDVSTMMRRKRQLVKGLTSGVRSLLTGNNITLFTGNGRLLADKQVEVNRDGNITVIHTKNIILAPGSTSRALPAIPIDDDIVVDSSGALSFAEVPNRLAVIGAGVIGLEMGSVWSRLGSKVSIYEYAPSFLPFADKQISKTALATYKKQGLEFNFGAEVTKASITSGKITLHYSNGDSRHQAEFEKIIVAVGRIPNTSDLFSDAAGIRLDNQGRIEVNEQCSTNVEGIYAIGDAVRGPMLAHKGSEEGMMVAELIAGQYARVDYGTIPFVVYTDPELAWCGKTEQALIEQDIPYSTGQFSFAANGRAMASGSATGMIRIHAHRDTDRVLGVHMIGPHVSELIGQAVIAMEFGSSSEDLAMTMFAHPSLSEVLHEAALDVTKRAIHKVSRK